MEAKVANLEDAENWEQVNDSETIGTKAFHHVEFFIEMPSTAHRFSALGMPITGTSGQHTGNDKCVVWTWEWSGAFSVNSSLLQGHVINWCFIDASACDIDIDPLTTHPIHCQLLACRRINSLPSMAWRCEPSFRGQGCNGCLWLVAMVPAPCVGNQRLFHLSRAKPKGG
jgi:hypothetical protein